MKKEFDYGLYVESYYKIDFIKFQSKIDKLIKAGITECADAKIFFLNSGYRKVTILDNEFGEHDIEKHLQKAIVLKNELVNAGITLYGKTLKNIEYLNASVLEKIARNKEKIQSLGIDISMEDAQYFNIDENLVEKLFVDKDKIQEITLKLGIKKLTIKHLSQKTLLSDKAKEEGYEEFTDKYNEKLNTIIDDNIIIDEKIKPKKEIKKSNVIDLTNRNYQYIGESYNSENIQNSFDNLSLFSELFELLKQELEQLSFNQFMDVSNLEANTISNYISLVKAGYEILLIELLEGYELSDSKTNLAIRLIQVDEKIWFDDIKSSNEQSLVRLISNIENYKKLLSHIGDEGRFLLFYKSTFSSQIDNLNNILESDNFEEFLQTSYVFKSIKPFNKELLSTSSISKILNILAPGEIEIFFKAIVNNLINGTKITELSKYIESGKKGLKLFLENIADNTEFYSDLDISDELIMLSREFGIEVSNEILDLNKKQNIDKLHDNNIDFEKNNFASLLNIMDELIEYGDLNGNITQENILLLSSILINNTEIKNYIVKKYNPETKAGDDLEMLAFKMEDDNKYLQLLEKIKDFFADYNEKRLTNYKSIVRAYNGLLYKEIESGGISITLKESINFVGFQFRDLSNSFLYNFANQIIDSYALNYLFDKKVRLQDIERIINNYSDFYNLNLNEYNKLVIDYALQTDNYDYIGQNIQAIELLLKDHIILNLLGGQNELANSWAEKFGQKINKILGSDKKSTKLTKEDIKKYIRDILIQTGGFITYSIFKGVVQEKRDINEVLQEFFEAKKQVISGNIPENHTDSLYEAIYLAYKPSGKTISQIKQEIDSGKVRDFSHHLDGIQRPENGYPMEFYTLSYELKEGQELDLDILENAQGIIKGNITIQDISKINVKSFFSTPTNVFFKDKDKKGKISLTPNIHIFEILTFLYSQNKDFRINGYKSNISFNYDQISSLQELFGVVAKDSFDKVIDKVIDTLSEEEVSKMLEKISKLKDKKLSQEFDKINKLDIGPRQKLSKLFYWRFLLYTNQLKGYINKEHSKYREIKGSLTQVKAVMNKDIGSYYAKSGAQLCTSDNTSMWEEKRHIHLNMIDHNKGEILGNIMLYFEEERDYLVVRGFNPRLDVESSFDIKSMTKEMIKVVKQIAIDNGYVDSTGEALVYTTTRNDGFHSLTNREEVRKVLKNELDKSSDKYGESSHIYNANFKPKSLNDTQKCNTLIRL